MKLILYALVLATSTMLISAARKMHTVYEWKYVDYVWKSHAQKQRAINSGEYNYTRVMPFDVDIAPDGRVFVAMVGRVGVPAVLGTVTKKRGPSGPLIKPYPNWSYFKKGRCDSIQNVYRIAIDECERLWVLDLGVVQEQTRICDPQLLAFDLRTDRLIRRIKIPKHIAVGKNNQTLLTAPIVETYGYKCQDTTVYMADAFGHGLIIWNNGKLSRLENPLFRPSEVATNITSGNSTQQWEVGIVTMDISPKLFPGEERYLYFHSLSSFDVYGASTRSLKRSFDGSDVKFVGAKYFLSSQAVGVAFSNYGTLFMGLTKESGIACWNKYRAMKPPNVEIVAQDSERLQYINGMKVKPSYDWNDEELWVVSNRLITYASNKMDFHDTNFRILKGSVWKLVAGTECDLPFEVEDALENGIEEWSSSESWEWSSGKLGFNRRLRKRDQRRRSRHKIY